MYTDSIRRDMASVQAILVLFAMFELVSLVSSESTVSELTVKEKRVLDRVSDILDKTGSGMSLREFQVFVLLKLRTRSLEANFNLTLSFVSLCAQHMCSTYIYDDLVSPEQRYISR